MEECKKGAGKTLSSRKKTRSSSRHSFRNVEPDEVVLVFPFNATYEKLDQAADGLTEANDMLVASENIDTEEIDDNTKHRTFQNVWKHDHTIRGEDYERLKPGKYLNDNLIDLWMTW